MKLVRIVLAGAFMFPAGGAGAATDAMRFHLEEASISDVQAAYRSGATTATISKFLNASSASCLIIEDRSAAHRMASLSFCTHLLPS